MISNLEASGMLSQIELLTVPELPKITPQGKDWQSEKILSRFISWFNEEIDDPRVQTNSQYDYENRQYIVNLLESDLDLRVVGEELEERSKRHSTYLNGDNNFRDVKESIIGIYNSLSEIIGRPSIESHFKSYFEGSNIKYVMRLLDSNLDPKIAGTELSNRALEKIETEGKVDCDKIKKEVIGVYNQLSNFLGRENTLSNDGCIICNSCALAGYWLG